MYRPQATPFDTDVVSQRERERERGGGGTFRGHSTREPASTGCDNAQGDLFYSADQDRKLR